MGFHVSLGECTTNVLFGKVSLVNNVIHLVGRVKVPLPMTLPTKYMTCRLYMKQRFRV